MLSVFLLKMKMNFFWAEIRNQNKNKTLELSMILRLK